MACAKFLLSQFVNEDDWFHLARVTIHSRYDLTLHCHDYAEIFWVEQGQGFHLVNGGKIPLNAGDLVMIRPEDNHTFVSSAGGLTIMNLAFPTHILADYQKKYFADNHSFFWIGSKMPYQTNINMSMISLISQKADKIWQHKKLRFYLDTLLLFIFGLLISDQDHEEGSKIPIWLQKAVQEYTANGNFKTGAAGFARICEKNLDYVNRMVRVHYQKTLSELITDLRMSFAAKQLIMTNSPVKSISLDCGLINLGHFHKTFKKTFNQTPIAFRYNNQLIV